jgi:hypothetical protein
MLSRLLKLSNQTGSKLVKLLLSKISDFKLVNDEISPIKNSNLSFVDAEYEKSNVSKLLAIHVKAPSSI